VGVRIRPQSERTVPRISQELMGKEKGEKRRRGGRKMEEDQSQERGNREIGHSTSGLGYAPKKTDDYACKLTLAPRGRCARRMALLRQFPCHRGREESVRKEKSDSRARSEGFFSRPQRKKQEKSKRVLTLGWA